MKVKLDKRKLESGSVSNTPKKTYKVQESEDRFEVEGLDQLTSTQIILGLEHEVTRNSFFFIYCNPFPVVG